MKRRGVETVRRMCRDIIHSNQPALDLLSSDYIASSFLSPRVLLLMFFPRQLLETIPTVNGHLSRTLEMSFSVITRLFSQT